MNLGLLRVHHDGDKAAVAGTVKGQEVKGIGSAAKYALTGDVYKRQVVIIVLHGDVHAVPAARAAPVVEEGKLERKAAVKVVEAGAPPVKDGCLRCV